jgi:hypothetical protein
MSVEFTDTLIDLSRPSCRAAFSRNPREFLRDRGLSDAEQNAILNNNLGAMWRHARSVNSPDPEQQFNRHVAKPDDLLIEIEPSLEMHQENVNGLVGEGAIAALGQLIVDDEGRLYRVVNEDIA